MASLGPEQTPSGGQSHSGGRHPCPQPGWLCGGGTGHPGAHDGPGGNSRGQEARGRVTACPTPHAAAPGPHCALLSAHQGACPAEGQGHHGFQGTYSLPETGSLYLPTTHVSRSRGNTEGSAQNRAGRLPFYVKASCCENSLSWRVKHVGRARHAVSSPQTRTATTKQKRRKAQGPQQTLSKQVKPGADTKQVLGRELV